MNIDWEKKINIDTQWVERQLIEHFTLKDFKITIRGYTPKTSGTRFNCNSLIEELGYFLTDYVHSERSKQNKFTALESKFGEELANKRLESALYNEAVSFFGKKNPETDGKYGELLLFALTESILKSKMVAHKIEGLSNFKDQVKGGDGIFLGNYEIEEGVFEPSILIGESKIMQGFSDCVDEAFDSINRFHLPKTQKEFEEIEFIVANKTIFMGDNDVDYDKIYDLLTPGTDAFRSQVIVHPILLMFNTNRIVSSEKKAKNKAELELMIKKFMEKEKSKFLNKIKKKLKSFPLIQRVYIDFFCFPFNNISEFREGMYFNIHKVPYK